MALAGSSWLSNSHSPFGHYCRKPMRLREYPSVRSKFASEPLGVSLHIPLVTRPSYPRTFWVYDQAAEHTRIGIRV